VNHAAAERVADANARKQLAKLSRLVGEVEPVTDALGALELLAGKAVRLVEILEAKVSMLKSPRYTSDQGLEQIRGEMVVYQQGLRDAKAILETLVRLDLETKRVRLEERQVEFIINAFVYALEDRKAALTTEQREFAMKRLRHEISPAMREHGTVTAHARDMS
jgi:hypothetical protein